ALTKLDVLSYMDEIPVCTAYEVNGERTEEFPFPAALDGAKPVIEYMKGWKCDISSVRTWDALPAEAKEYVLFVQRTVGVPVTYVSVGAERESIIFR
ncbi:MAG: adenylosuccinate synthetase, partial [Oscillospiraceae bacterium]|nr:adenylosuccinate synthetase [Oscillospiraceae bacterium]